MGLPSQATSKYGQQARDTPTLPSREAAIEPLGSRIRLWSSDKGHPLKNHVWTAILLITCWTFRCAWTTFLRVQSAPAVETLSIASTPLRLLHLQKAGTTETHQRAFLHTH